MGLRRALDLPLVLTMAATERACGQARKSTPLRCRSRLPRRGGEAEASSSCQLSRVETAQPAGLDQLTPRICCTSRAKLRQRVAALQS